MNWFMRLLNRHLCWLDFHEWEPYTVKPKYKGPGQSMLACKYCEQVKRF